MIKKSYIALGLFFTFMFIGQHANAELISLTSYDIKTIKVDALKNTYSFDFVPLDAQEEEPTPLEYCQELYQTFVDAIRNGDAQIVGLGDVQYTCVDDADGIINNLFYECTNVGEAENNTCFPGEFYGGVSRGTCHNWIDPIENCPNPANREVQSFRIVGQGYCFDNAALGELAENHAACLDE